MWQRLIGKVCFHTGVSVQLLNLEAITMEALFG